MRAVGQSLSALEPWLNQLLMQVRPQRRRATMRLIANKLRQSNQARARAQTNPDGSAWAPRSSQRWARYRAAKDGRSGPMFKKMIGRMGVDSGTDFAKIGFRGGTLSWMAGVHQFGDTVDVAGHDPRAQVTFPIRAMLGISEEDKAMIAGLVLGVVRDQNEDDA
jgi:phage virion morphogenesis protein